MRGYLLGVVIVSMIMGIFEIIAPKHGGIEKYTKTIGLLCILCVAVAPFKEILGNINDNFFGSLKEEILDGAEDNRNGYNEILKEYLNDFSQNEFIAQIKEILNEQFAIPAEECEIDITTSTESGNLKVDSMQILLSGRSVFKNPYTIEEYFNKLLDCECQVLIK